MIYLILKMDVIQCGVSCFTNKRKVEILVK